jgi:hypothetical protein
MQTFGTLAKSPKTLLRNLFFDFIRSILNKTQALVITKSEIVQKPDWSKKRLQLNRQTHLDWARGGSLSFVDIAARGEAKS